jgi:phosphoribosylcarboxyaminoimidazole (NCAIR) mutase
LQEFDATLKRMLDGDMTLVSALGQVKLAAAAAVASAFRTPEVIRAFAAREPAALRGRLAALNEDARLGRMTAAAAKVAAIEIILALKKLGEALTADEAAALASASAAQRAGFEAADRAIAEASVMSMTRAS